MSLKNLVTEHNQAYLFHKQYSLAIKRLIYPSNNKGTVTNENIYCFFA